MSLSKWGSSTLSSKRVWAETVGFFHRRWVKRVKGERNLCLGLYKRFIALNYFGSERNCRCFAYFGINENP